MCGSVVLSLDTGEDLHKLKKYFLQLTSLVVWIGRKEVVRNESCEVM